MGDCEWSRIPLFPWKIGSSCSFHEVKTGLLTCEYDEELGKLQ